MVRDTGALYVRIDDTLHPVLNLASARLITGATDEPELISMSALDRAQRGPLVGIPGAPEIIAAPLDADESVWTVCDDAVGRTSVLVGRPPRLDRAKCTRHAAVRARRRPTCSTTVGAPGWIYATPPSSGR